MSKITGVQDACEKMPQEAQSIKIFTDARHLRSFFIKISLYFQFWGKHLEIQNSPLSLITPAYESQMQVDWPKDSVK
jgi:hypothetical protein